MCTRLSMDFVIFQRMFSRRTQLHTKHEFQVTIFYDAIVGAVVSSIFEMVADEIHII